MNTTILTKRGLTDELLTLIREDLIPVLSDAVPGLGISESGMNGRSADDVPTLGPGLKYKVAINGQPPGLQDAGHIERGPVDVQFVLRIPAGAGKDDFHRIEELTAATMARWRPELIGTIGDYYFVGIDRIYDNRGDGHWWQCEFIARGTGFYRFPATTVLYNETTGRPLFAEDGAILKATEE